MPDVSEECHKHDREDEHYDGEEEEELHEAGRRAAQGAHHGLQRRDPGDYGPQKVNYAEKAKAAERERDAHDGVVSGEEAHRVAEL